MGTKRKIKKTLQKLNENRPCTRKEIDAVFNLFNYQFGMVAKIIAHFLSFDLPEAIADLAAHIKEVREAMVNDKI